METGLKREQLTNRARAAAKKTSDKGKEMFSFMVFLLRISPGSIPEVHYKFV
jgi:hypothetical protein